MIKINDFFSAERTKHGWILFHRIPYNNKDNEIAYKSKKTHYADIQQVCSAVIEHSLNGALAAYLAPEATSFTPPDLPALGKTSTTEENEDDDSDNEEVVGENEKKANIADFQLENVEQILAVVEKAKKDILEAIINHTDQIVINQRIYKLDAYKEREKYLAEKEKKKRK